MSLMMAPRPLTTAAGLPRDMMSGFTLPSSDGPTEEKEALTFDELMHPEKIFGDNFKSRGFVPVAECLNGDFVGYDKKLKKWLWLGVLGRKKEEVYMDEEDVMDILWEIEDEVSR